MVGVVWCNLWVVLTLMGKPSASFVSLTSPKSEGIKRLETL